MAESRQPAKLNKARRLLQEGEAAKAAELCHHLLAACPSDFPALQLLSRACQISGDLNGMLQAARSATELRPRNVDARVRLAECLVLVGDVAAALELAAEVEQRAVATAGAGALRRVAGFYQRLGLLRPASRCWQQALEINADDPSALFGAATCAKTLGQPQTARKAIDRLIYLQPEHYAACYLRSTLQRQTTDSNFIRELVYALEHCDEAEPGRVELYHALAKELDDIGSVEDAQQVLALGAGLRAQQLNYDVEPDLALFEAIRACFAGRTAAADQAPTAAPCPVLLVGLPLSGLEVLAAVLAEHPDATNLGATDMLAMSVQKAGGGPWRRGGWLEQRNTLDLPALGHDYLQRIQALAPKQHWLVDAQPTNTQYLGLVTACLPQARIVHIHRQPKDNALALYRTLLHGQAPYSCDLTQLVRYQRGHEQLMQHWAGHCGAQMLSVDYDLLLLEPGPQLHRIGAFLGMPEADALANLLQRSQPAETAAARHIRTLLDEHRSGRWRRYEQLFKSVDL